MTFDQQSLFDLRVELGTLAVGDTFSHSGWDHSVVLDNDGEQVQWETTDAANGKRVGVSMSRAMHRVVERR